MISIFFTVSGETKRVTLNVRLAQDYPLDVYYLSDLSGSFTNDLTNLKLSATRLGKITNRLIPKHTKTTFSVFGIIISRFDVCRQ